MSEIVFDSIGLKLVVNKVAISVFGIDIYWYSIFILIGILISLIILKKKENLYQISFENVVELMIVSIPMGAVGARLYYCLFNYDYYYNNIKEIFDLRNGGIAIYGGIIAGVFSIYLYCKKRKISFLNVLDLLSPCLALCQSIGRWGNFTNVEAFGEETSNIFRMGIIEKGIYKEVHPTFLYESFFDFIIFLYLIKKQKNRKYQGQIVYLYLMLYSFIRFFIEDLRQDSLMLGPIKISQALSLIIFIVSLVKIKSQSHSDNKTHQN